MMREIFCLNLSINTIVYWQKCMKTLVKIISVAIFIEEYFFENKIKVALLDGCINFSSY